MLLFALAAFQAGISRFISPFDFQALPRPLSYELYASAFPAATTIAAMGVLSKFMVSLPYHCYEVAHPWSETCSYAWLYVFLSCVRESMKIYGILYLVSIFLFFFYMLLQNHYKKCPKGLRRYSFFISIYDK